MAIIRLENNKANLCHRNTECGRHNVVYVLENSSMEVQFCEEHFQEFQGKYPQSTI